MSSNHGSPPTPPPDGFVPLTLRLLGLHEEEPGADHDWTVVIAARGFETVPDALSLAAASGELAAMVRQNPPLFFERSGWSVADPVPNVGDRVEVVVVLVGDFDYLWENENGRL